MHLSKSISRWFLCAAMLGLLSSFAVAQTQDIPYHLTPHFWASAVYAGAEGISGEAVFAESHKVEMAGAPWVRLTFGSVKLGAKSYLTITSLKDGATQKLNARQLAEWYNTSAYFNGETVEIKLFVEPNDKGIFAELKEVMVGDLVSPPESQCGPTDDRVPSSHPASGRIVNIGCTGWIVANGKHVTAGHCSGSASAGTLEFNVPPSLSNGTIQHPGPQDQYSINQGSWQFVNGGIGNDWGIFQVFNNSQTGLQPIQAQGASFNVVQNLGPATIRITGFGVDNNDPTRNQTQQTHAGPNAGSSGTTMKYVTDTEGGNSGSPVIDDATGNAVGVHTHGGCSTGGGNNNGTSTFNAAFWSALSGTPSCTNIALNKTATASSTNGSNTPNRAVDGSAATFWRSASGGTQWLTVDLGAGTLSYSQVTINWRTNRHAKSFRIVVTNDPTFTTRTSVFNTTSGTGGTQTITLTGAPRTERYIRLHMTVVNSSYYAVNEFEVCGTSSAAGKAAVELTAATVPTEMALQQNYPNPFSAQGTFGNPTTQISFSVPSAAHVTLKIFNIAGQEVTTLVDQVRERGNYAVAFVASSHLASGVYFAVLQAGAERQVRRLVLMK